MIGTGPPESTGVHTADFAAGVRLEWDLIKRSRTWVGGGSPRGREEWHRGESLGVGRYSLEGARSRGSRARDTALLFLLSRLGNPGKDTGLGRGGRWILQERQWQS